MAVESGMGASRAGNVMSRWINDRPMNTKIMLIIGMLALAAVAVSAGVDSRDEIGQMARGLDAASGRLRETVSHIGASKVLGDDRLRRGGADGDDQRDRAQRVRGGGRVERHRAEHHRRGERRPVDQFRVPGPGQ